MILRARGLLCPDGSVRESASLLVVEGRIERLLLDSAAVRRASGPGTRVHDLGDGFLLPGLVDAHAHLELSALRGRLPGTKGFGAWIRGLLAARPELRPEDYRLGVEEGARRLLAGGTTAVGDIASTESGAHAARGAMRSIVYREVLDAWDPGRTESALRTVSRALPGRRARSEGISPHAPYTTSEGLLRRVGELARRRRLPVTVHWAEIEAEVSWLRDGSGPLATYLRTSPRTTGLDLLHGAGLLNRRTSLAHGNHPGRGDARRLTRHGIVLVHCPGTHRFFEREPFPLRHYRRAGVEVALGTDSLASNEDLDMRREMALFRSAHPEVAPAEVLRMATSAGARALGLFDQVGALRRGLRADVALHHVDSRDPSRVLDAVTNGESVVREVWVAGRRCPFRSTEPLP